SSDVGNREVVLDPGIRWIDADSVFENIDGARHLALNQERRTESGLRARRVVAGSALFDSSCFNPNRRPESGYRVAARIGEHRGIPKTPRQPPFDRACGVALKRDD